MQTVEKVRCPNCGNFAERRCLIQDQVMATDCIIQTECLGCDYLMVMSLPTGRVIEAYAPGQVGHYLPPSILLPPVHTISRSMPISRFPS
jgi:hypothetical protein